MNTPDDADMLKRECQLALAALPGLVPNDREKRLASALLSRLTSPAVNTADAVMEEREAIIEIADDMRKQLAHVFQTTDEDAHAEMHDALQELIEAIRARGTAVEEAAVQKKERWCSCGDPICPDKAPRRAAPTEEAGKDAEDAFLEWADPADIMSPMSQAEFYDHKRTWLAACAWMKRTGVGDGYRLVPVEPTLEMIKAGSDIDSFSEHDPSDVYKSMIAAAPVPKETT